MKLDDGSGFALLKEEYLKLVPWPALAAAEALPATPPTTEPKLSHTEAPLASSSTAGPMPVTQWPAPRPRYSVAATWTAWAPEELRFDDESQCFKCKFKIGFTGSEGFQLLRSDSQPSYFHPAERLDGCSNVQYALGAPRDQKKAFGKNWTVGKHGLDRAAVGDPYELRLVFCGEPKVEWSRLSDTTVAEEEALDSAAAAGGSKNILTGEGWCSAKEVEGAQRKADCESRSRFVSRQMQVQRHAVCGGAFTSDRRQPASFEL